VTKTTKRVIAVVVGIFGLLVLVGLIEDGIDRWDLSHGEGVPGTFIVEGTEEVHYGKPPSTTRLIGTFETEDGALTREVHLGEGSPDGTHIGDRLDVVWDHENPERVFLSDTRAFRNWVESMIFLVVWFTGMGVVALLIRRHRRSQAAIEPEPRHAA
jgi:hypothetical protein